MAPADQFFALADATRCRVVEMLSARSMPVHELTAAFSISRPAISRHLRVLKTAGLVKEVKRGRENIYSLERQRLGPVQKWLEEQSSSAAARPAKPRKSVKAVTGEGRAAGTAAKRDIAATERSTPAPAAAIEIVPVKPPRQKVKPPAPPRLAESQLTLF